MIDKVKLQRILFLDIETVSGFSRFEDLPERFQPLWARKASSLLRRPLSEIEPDEISRAYTERAGIFAEFGKIVCISVGLITQTDDRPVLRIKSFAHRDENVLLSGFAEMVLKHYNNPAKSHFCGHNIKEFDIPYICRRMIINGIKLPDSLDIRGKKPWETAQLLDTLELWKFGDYKNYTSLKLLTALFNIPSPKDDIDGSEVGRVYWEEDDLQRIATYCEKDVVATAQLFLSYRREPHLSDEQLVFLNGEG